MKDYSYHKKVIEDVTEKLNELDICCDLSHLNEKSFYKAAELADMPLVTHACCRTVCGHKRNLTDEQLRMISEKNGIIGLCFYPDFLGGDVFDAVDDGLIFIAENNIAVFSHQFQNQILAPQISHIVIVLDLKVDNPLQLRLPDPQDLSVSHMLAQQHTEIGGGERPGLVGFCDIN